MARFTNTLSLNTTDWVSLNPNNETTVIIQAWTVGGIRIVLADALDDIVDENGHTLNVDTGRGTVFYGLGCQVFAKAITAKPGESTLTVTAYTPS